MRHDQNQSAAVDSRSSRSLDWLHLLLGFAQVMVLVVFCKHAYQDANFGLVGVSLLAIGLAIVGAVAGGNRCEWSGWPILCAASWTASIGIWGLSDAKQAAWWFAIAIAAMTFLLVLKTPTKPIQVISTSIRIFCLAVSSLTIYVTFWGLLFPTGTGLNVVGLAKGFNDGMPFVPVIPPLHSRFIGSLYLGATVVCLYNVVSQRKSSLWYLQILIFSWTFILLLATLTNLSAFNWKTTSVWFWMVAYLAFPAISYWILVRIEPEPREVIDPPVADGPKAWLLFQGCILITASLIGTFASPFLAAYWPWKLPELLARIYSAPFATFAISSFALAYARGRQRSAIIPIAIAIESALIGTLVSSIVHRDKFDFGNAKAWVWFGLLSLMALGNLYIGIATWFLDRKPATMVADS